MAVQNDHSHSQLQKGVERTILNANPVDKTRGPSKIIAIYILSRTAAGQLLRSPMKGRTTLTLMAIAMAMRGMDDDWSHRKLPLA
jgi:hypothetical protein